MTACIQFVGNQGGEPVLAFYLSMANGLAEQQNGVLQGVFTTWLRTDKSWLEAKGVVPQRIICFEEFVAARPAFDIEAEADYLNQAYPDVNWSVVIAAERSFTDYSMLLGAAGNRPESREYIIRLMGNLVRFYEQAYAAHSPLAVVTQTADTIISFVAIKVAHQLRIPVRSIVPAWLLEPGAEGGFFATDEFLCCRAMHAQYATLRTGKLGEAQRCRVAALQQSIRNFDGNTAFYKSAGRTGGTLLSPHLIRLSSYMKANQALDKNVAYTRFSPKHKIRANFVRLWRKYCARSLLGSPDLSLIPAKSVFYAMHMQPEQSTLAQGIWQVNQIALIENISKALPVGYTLVLKEHPYNRGFRPAWQYQHLHHLYNVRFCDAPSKAIVQRVAAVITISGTIGMESLVLGKPVVLLGGTFYDFCELLFRPDCIERLPGVLRTILVDKSYPQGEALQSALDGFLAAYLEGMVPAYPLPQNGQIWSQYLLNELSASGLLTTPSLSQS